VGSALLRYRVVAWVVGTVLLVLVFVAMPLKYLADRPAAVAIVGPIHGFLFIVYLIATFDISMRQRWPLTRMLLLGLAGTVPVLTFVAERWVTRHVPSKQLA
jgi:integral membrane protein